MREYVTVCVLCYNSSSTIIELLDSIYTQTYQWLDLIINDDASTDNTVGIVKEWIRNHRERFHKIKLHINERNRGITYSFDHALRLCETEWIKPIGGDDILFDDCISLNINYVREHHINSILFSKMVAFSDDKSNYIAENEAKDRWMKRTCRLNAQSQYQKILRSGIYYVPTEFLSKTMYCDMGGLPNQIRDIEDGPLCLQLTKSGYRMHFMKEVTVYYREGNNSISRSKGNVYNVRHIKEVILMNKLLICPNIPFYDVVFWWRKGVELLRFFLVIIVFGNKNTRMLRMFNNALLALDPKYWGMILYKINTKIKRKL